MHAAQTAPTACDYQGHDFIVITNSEKLDKLEKFVLDALPDSDLKKHFIERRDRHGIKKRSHLRCALFCYYCQKWESW